MAPHEQVTQVTDEEMHEAMDGLTERQVRRALAFVAGCRPEAFRRAVAWVRERD